MKQRARAVAVSAAVALSALALTSCSSDKTQAPAPAASKPAASATAGPAGSDLANGNTPQSLAAFGAALSASIAQMEKTGLTETYKDKSNETLVAYDPTTKLDYKAATLNRLTGKVDLLLEKNMFSLYSLQEQVNAIQGKTDTQTKISDNGDGTFTYVPAGMSAVTLTVNDSGLITTVDVADGGHGTYTYSVSDEGAQLLKRAQPNFK